ncbi:unnamed protein product [Hapterophycus canaliculatus]
MGMEHGKTDPRVFRKIRDGVVALMVVVRVDDTAEAGTEDESPKLHEALDEDFTTNDLGEVSLLTGCVFARGVEEGYFTITQTAFIDTLGRRFDVTTTSDFPAVIGANSRVKEGRGAGMAVGLSGSCRLPGVWLVTMTRPDIANAVRAVARHSHNPTERHWKAVLKIVQSLLGNKHLGLTVERGSGLNMTSWTDS